MVFVHLYTEVHILRQKDLMLLNYETWAELEVVILAFAMSV